MRLLRQIFSVLLVVVYVSATIITVAPVANAAPQGMSGGMTMKTGDASGKMPMPCSKNMKPGCVTELGCMFMVSLPVANPGIATVIGWSTVTYTVSAEFLPRIRSSRLSALPYPAPEPKRTDNRRCASLPLAIVLTRANAASGRTRVSSCGYEL